MRIFLFLTFTLFVWGCSTVEVTREVIKVTNTIADRVKDSVPKKENEGEIVLEKIIDENKIEEDLEIIEEKQKEVKNIIKNQQKFADINFIGKKEDKIINLLGPSKLKRIDGSVYTLRYDSNTCRLFLFFNQSEKNKRVEYFELRNTKAQLLNSKQTLEQCYKEFNLLN
jgi:hypothetical protein